MSDDAGTSIHASAVLVDTSAVLIRGPSGSGKSRLAFELILAGRSGQLPPVRLVGDDRIRLRASHGHLMVRPAPELAGLIEIRGLGIRRYEFTEQAMVGLVVDLAAADAERLPPPDALFVTIFGFMIPRIPVMSGWSALPLVIAALTTAPAVITTCSSEDCLQGVGNHISPMIAS
jgi:serine kinase of HPr protein (carbohydrate metabolism regulator)